MIADLGNLNTDAGNYWLNIYVMLSRAVAMENLMLFRCPPKSFFDEGPPKYLREFLESLEEMEHITTSAADKAKDSLGL